MSTQIEQNTLDLRALLEQANSLPEASEGVELPELTYPGTAADLMNGKELIDGDGNIVTGTMPTVTQATPSISVSSSGLITARATQSAGYVASGTKSATEQLATKGAETITPGTSDKTIASGRYLTGTQTIKGDANLIPENIVSGKSIFGVVGRAETGGGGSVNKETVTVTIIANGFGEAYYYDSNGSCHTIRNQTVAVEALGGLVFYRKYGTSQVDVSGNYNENATYEPCFRFFEDGGTITFIPDGPI